MPDFTVKLSQNDLEKIKAFIQGTADAIRPMELVRIFAGAAGVPAVRLLAAVCLLPRERFFLQNGCQSFWDSNYASLLTVKDSYDPDGLFIVHCGVTWLWARRWRRRRLWASVSSKRQSSQKSACRKTFLTFA